MKKFICLLVVIVMVTGCKSPKKVQTVNISERKQHNEFFDAMNEQAFRFSTLTARLNVDLDIPGKELSSRVDLKMIKDSALQLSVVPVLGIEIFRIELTKDSIKIVDRLNKRYMADNYEKMRSETPVAFNFYNLQALFTNRIFIPGEQYIHPTQYQRFTLNQEGAKAEVKITDNLDIQYSFQLDGEEKLLTTYITDAGVNHALIWKYSDFRIVSQQPFPLLMETSLSSNGEYKGGLKIYYSRMQVDEPVRMDFAIPDKYRRVSFNDIIRSLTN